MRGASVSAGGHHQRMADVDNTGENTAVARIGSGLSLPAFEPHHLRLHEVLAQLAYAGWSCMPFVCGTRPKRATQLPRRCLRRTRASSRRASRFTSLPCSSTAPRCTRGLRPRCLVAAHLLAGRARRARPRRSSPPMRTCTRRGRARGAHPRSPPATPCTAARRAFGRRHPRRAVGRRFEPAHRRRHCRRPAAQTCRRTRGRSTAPACRASPQVGSGGERGKRFGVALRAAIARALAWQGLLARRARLGLRRRLRPRRVGPSGSRRRHRPRRHPARRRRRRRRRRVDGVAVDVGALSASSASSDDALDALAALLSSRRRPRPRPQLDRHAILIFRSSCTHPCWTVLVPADPHPRGWPRASATCSGSRRVCLRISAESDRCAAPCRSAATAAVTRPRRCRLRREPRKVQHVLGSASSPVA